jgi:acetoin utilization deacetylase AcuC-like enzyme
VLISAGFDAALGDPLGGQAITPAGYGALTQDLLQLAGGKVVLVLEGGYKWVHHTYRHPHCTPTAQA